MIDTIHRIRNTLKSGIEKVILCDLKTGNVVDITESDYQFTSRRDDNPDRFKIMIQKRSNKGINDIDNLKPIVWSYEKDIHITLPDVSLNSYVTITDISGRVIKHQVLTALNSSVSVNMSGIYVVRVVCDNILTIRKLIID